MSIYEEAYSDDNTHIRVRRDTERLDSNYGILCIFCENCQTLVVDTKYDSRLAFWRKHKDCKNDILRTDQTNI
jgi:hypothetical protein